jgi:hypothetical protein
VLNQREIVRSVKCQYLTRSEDAGISGDGGSARRFIYRDGIIVKKFRLAPQITNRVGRKRPASYKEATTTHYSRSTCDWVNF